MDLRKLQTFVNVAQARSFTAAARDLHLSQSAVSQQIAALEHDLGARLLDRRRRRIAPTPAGAALLEWSERLLADAEIARRAVAAAEGRVSGTLRIAASLTIAAYLLPRSLAQLTREHPDVRSFVEVQNTEHVTAALRGGRADLGLVEGDVADEGVVVQPVREDELVVIAPARHRFAREDEIDLRQLTTEPFIAREPGSGTRQVAEEALRRAGLPAHELRIAAELSAIEAIKASVEAGLGIAIVSLLSVRRELHGGSLIARPVRGVPMRRRLAAAFGAGQPVLPAARELVRLLARSPSTAGGVDAGG